jgi:hypothetical protein
MVQNRHKCDKTVTLVLNDEVRMTNDEGMTKSENALANSDSFWNDSNDLIARCAGVKAASSSALA